MSIDAAAAAMELADRLRKSLGFDGITVDEMADHLGITPQTVEAWLHGREPPRLTMLMVRANIARAPFERLTGAEEDPSR